MAVRKTESRIQEDLSPSDLGQASESIEIGGRKCTIISYLKENLIRFNSGRLSDNTYVVFIEGADNLDIVTYKWIIEKYNTNLNVWQPAYTDPSFSDKPVLFSNLEIWKRILCMDSMSELRFSVEINIQGLGNGTIPPLVQKIRNFSDEFQGKEENGSNSAISGEKSITNEINNHYLNCIESLKETEPELGNVNGNQYKKIRLILAILYGNLVAQQKKIGTKKAIFPLRKMITDKWESFINYGRSYGSLEEYTTGICGINPVLLSMFVGDNILNIGYNPANIVKREDAPANSSSFLNYLYDHKFFPDEVSETKLIDIYNVLRFPQSCIRATSLYLEQLKKRKDETKNIPWNTLITDRGKLEILMDEFWNGPTDQIIERIKPKTKAIDLINNDFLVQLSRLTICEKLRVGYYAKIETGTLDPFREEAKAFWKNVKSCVLTKTLYLFREPYPFLPEVYHEVYRERLFLDCVTQDDNVAAPQIIIELLLSHHEWSYGDEIKIPTLGEASEKLNVLSTEEFQKYREKLARNGVAHAYSVFSKTDGEKDNRTSYESLMFFRALFKEMYEHAVAFECEKNTANAEKEYLIKNIEQIDELLNIDSSQPIKEDPNHLLIEDLAIVNLETKIEPFQLPGYEQATISSIAELNHNIPKIFSEYTYEYMEPLRLQFKLNRPKPVENPSDDSPLENTPDLNTVVAALREWSLKASGKVKLTICGYADMSYTGSGNRRHYNEALSKRRIDWFLDHFDLATESNIDNTAEVFACGDKYSKEPEDNSEFREIRLVFRMLDNFY